MNGRISNRGIASLICAAISIAVAQHIWQKVQQNKMPWIAFEMVQCEAAQKRTMQRRRKVLLRKSKPLEECCQACNALNCLMSKRRWFLPWTTSNPGKMSYRLIQTPSVCWLRSSNRQFENVSETKKQSFGAFLEAQKHFERCAKKPENRWPFYSLKNLRPKPLTDALARCNIYFG